VAVSGDGGEAGDTVRADEIVDFSALDISTAMITAAESGVACTRPRLARDTGRQILRVGPEVQRACGVAPDFPGGLGFAELI